MKKVSESLLIKYICISGDRLELTVSQGKNLSLRFSFRNLYV